MTDFILQPSENPGSHERHLNRKHNNPLFGERQLERNQDTMLQTQQADHDILIDFHQQLQKAIQDAMNLGSNVDSDVILKIKDNLDRLYEKASIVADDQTDTKHAIQQLLGVIMQAIRKGAGNDSQAHDELDQEEAARTAHFNMLESKLVADLLDPDSPIHKDELIPTLLSADKDDLALAVRLFDEDQLTLLIRDCEKLINVLGAQDVDIRDAAENLVFIQGYVEFLNLSQNEVAS